MAHGPLGTAYTGTGAMKQRGMELGINMIRLYIYICIYIQSSLFITPSFFSNYSQKTLVSSHSRMGHGVSFESVLCCIKSLSL